MVMTRISDQNIKRQHAEHVRLDDRQVVFAAQGLTHGVERAGADVAVHDTERRQCQHTVALRGIAHVASR